MGFEPHERKHHRSHTLSQRSNGRTLQFLEDGTFQITVFSDLHLAEDEDNEKGPIKDAKTSEVLKKVLEYENSQLVVLNGDLISGYGTVADNATIYLDQIVAPIVESGLPWATTYGNHDNERYSRSKDLLRREQDYSNSLTQNMLPDHPQAGVSNYFLQVYSASGNQEVPEVILWFFDSRGGDQPHDWVDNSVVDWFKETSASLTERYKKTIPSLAFFHIPITATYNFQTSPGVNPSKEPGVDGEKVWWQGRMFDDKTGHDEAFMTALSNTDGLLATFSGHDHDNDWCYKWRPGANQAVAKNGVSVCYGRHTGYGSYGNLPRGGRQILLKQETLSKEAITWIRLEDGSVSANVTLNATYGQDEYHPLGQDIELKRSQFGIVGDGLQIVPGLYSVAIFLLLIVYFPLRLWVNRQRG
ncbi:Metallo-dependent phosphatase-like protein [Hypoxylon trugodes]|uniref:Metallo-dependent phosphatase-like protein n=1 Tax=Hypoxylon trugodes TaxID=326681 RepID=UPI0021901C1F|nr:Metallo-dependent phosphatase-like protein [Hypoxylon trugodes]KAI1392456.1 Metallo-dependent phosphatase-like protein [Hypoxylon trugodes]